MKTKTCIFAILGVTFLSIQSLALAQTVTLSVTGTPPSGNPYSISATVTGIPSISKVEFVNSDNHAIIRTEATAPYCIFGDTIPNPCNLGRLGRGTHHVVAKAYETGIPTARATSAILTITEPFRTRVSRNGENFLINGLVTHPGTPLEGTLPNSRMVQATFDDANPNTVGNWRYPNGSPYSASRQTNEFVAALPNYKAKGLLAVTLNFQGGNPIHGAIGQPWDNTAFNSDGTLKSAYLTRMNQAIRALDARGMIAILGYFYQGQDQRLASESAIRAAVTNATAWVLNQGYTNVMIEVVNESGNAGINYSILQPARVNELITAVQNQSQNFGRRLLTATSFNGGVTTGIPTNVRSSEDFILLHGNNQTATQITSMINTVRSWNLNKPIIFNEDDPVMAKFQAATNGHASWGYLDHGTNNYFDGFQSPPTNWSINTTLKQTFFNKVENLSTPDGPSSSSSSISASVTLSVTETPLSGNPYSVEATVTGINSVSRVEFVNSDNNAIIWIAATAPYCIFSDTAGTCTLGRLGPGTHRVKAQAFETNNPLPRATSSILTITEPVSSSSSSSSATFQGFIRG